jgi:hypothetical protein
MVSFLGPSLTPDWFSGLASSLGRAIENRKAGGLLSSYIDDVYGEARPTSGLDYTSGLQDDMPGASATSNLNEYANRRVSGAFENIAANGGDTGVVVPERYRSFYETAGQKYGFDPGFLARQGYAESGFNPNAVSPAGARGISQFMPATAQDYGIDPSDPEQSIDAQGRYLANSREQFGDNEAILLASYNWGPGNVEKWLERGADPSRMPAETRDYIEKVTGRPVEAHLQGSQTAVGNRLGPGAGDMPGSGFGASRGAPGLGAAGQPGMPDRETLKAMARNPQTREFVIDILTAQRKGQTFADLPTDIQEYLYAQNNPQFAQWLDRNENSDAPDGTLVTLQNEAGDQIVVRQDSPDVEQALAAGYAPYERPRDSESPITRAGRLRQEYQTLPETKDFNTIRGSFNKLQASAATDSGPGDLALIFSYMKMLDPGSVVRETEFANAQNAGGVPETIRNAWNRALTGERLTPQMRQQFVTSASDIYGSAASRQQDIAARYSDLAQKYGVEDPSMVVEAIDAPAPPPSAPAAGLPQMATPEEAMQLPPGTAFIDSEGNRRIRP